MKCHLQPRSDYGVAKPGEFEAVAENGVVYAIGRLVLDVPRDQPTGVKLDVSFETEVPTGEVSG